ncbi:MAG: hypothetical protein H0T73_13505 [Ardenticatenales bacterium]|nr:hypothetical protein [Ardenticatenales bacterium]
MSPSIPPTLVAPFARGPRGDIFPPPLHAGQALNELTGQFLAAHPEEAKALQPHHLASATFHSIVLLWWHQLRLRQVLSGQAETPTEQALYKAIMTQREALSVRPLGDEDLRFLTFYPCLQRLGPTRWRMGWPGSREEAFEAQSGDEALAQAQQRLVAWADEEEALGGV